MEAFGMATMRNLPDAHPLYKLLRPHFRYTMSINSAARKVLITETGTIAQNFAIGAEGLFEFMERGGKAYDVTWTNIRKHAIRRGVDDPKKLPGYHYRDDGFLLWDAIEEYVKGIIDIFYASDAEVKSDEELRNWVQELYEIGFFAVEGAVKGHGFPEKIEKKADLIEWCTLIIFTGSCQHASVNYGQFDTSGYQPNGAYGMRKPPPKRQDIQYQDLMDYLPDIPSASMSISVVYILVQFSTDEVKCDISIFQCLQIEQIFLF